MYLLKLRFSLDIYPGLGLKDHMWILCLVFQGTPILFSIMDVPTYIPTNNVRGSLFSPWFPAFIVCRLFDDGHLCEVIPHCSFDLHSCSLGTVGGGSVSNAQDCLLVYPSALLRLRSGMSLAHGYVSCSSTVPSTQQALNKCAGDEGINLRLSCVTE